MTAPVVVNGTAYRWPARPLVVVCVDGGDPAYFERAVPDGLMPTAARFMRDGFYAVAHGTVPSFTCPNNLSIVTGAPASVHGISGNFFLDPATGEAVPMTGPELLRAPTILAGFAARGARVAMVTAKDKLRRQLGHGIDLKGGSVCISSERADRVSVAENGIADALGLAGLPLPDMYSAELSLFVLAIGRALLEGDPPLIIYLSLSDYVQHKHAPGTPEADRFMAAIDRYLGAFDAAGATVAVTADHGMNDKARPDGSPNVIWLQDALDRAFGARSTRVICPITDAFVAHHGALGGFVRVYCRGVEPARVIALVRAMPGVAFALPRDEAVERFELPADREADVVVIGDGGTALGAAEAAHDLAGLKGARLRTHGALAEARVPVLLNRPLRPAYAERARAGLKSHRVFDLALNGTAA